MKKKETTAFWDWCEEQPFVSTLTITSAVLWIFMMVLAIVTGKKRDLVEEG